jgi:hypothetical protein
VIPEPTESEDRRLIEAGQIRQGRRVAYVSIAWTSLEAIVGSIADWAAQRLK